MTNIPLDSSASDSTHNTVVYDNNKNQYVNNISMTQRSLSDIYVAFKWEYNTIIKLTFNTLERNIHLKLLKKY